MIESPPQDSVGLLGSLRGFADGLLGSAHDRLELLSIELQEEKHRLIQILFWVSGIVLLGFLATVFVSFALVVWLWETARLAAVCTLAGFYVVAATAAILGFRRYLRRQRPPFGGTLQELRADRECIQPEN